MRKAPRRRPLLACLALALGVVSAPAHAVVLVDSAGFESPSFATGALLGQQQWTGAEIGSAVALVQDSTVESGSQAVRVTRGASSSGFWAEKIPNPQSGRFVSIDWDMLIEATGAEFGLGPFFGVNVFDDSTGSIATLGALGVDATTGDVLIQQGGTGFLIATGVSAVPDVWMHYRIEIDFLNDSYAAFVDGFQVATTSFVDNAFGIDRLTDADIAAFAAGGDAPSANQAGVAFFDNFVVRDGLRSDYNGDGVVDAADYTLWRDQAGQSGFFLTADGNADGVVDNEDYALWESEFGQTNSLPPASTGVPEPAGLTLVLLAAACGAPRRRC